MAFTHRLTARLLRTTSISSRSPFGPVQPLRVLSTSLPRRSSEDSKKKPPGHNEEHQGTFSRTDRDVQVNYPAEQDIPPSSPAQGRGAHFKRTLAGFSLEDRVGVVTGGARGLGLVMAQALVISGADVALVDLNKDEAQRQASDIVAHYQEENPDAERIPKVTAHFADVADAQSAEAAVQEIVKEHGKIDHLITSAGFTENFDAIGYPPDRFKKLWGVNFDGTYNFATTVAKHLMQRQAKGSMVLIGSMSGAVVNVPQPQAPYNASKAAVRQLAASLAVEWAHADIRVNCISPGYMLTALTKKIMEEKPEFKNKWTSLIPSGRMGNPEDLMGAVVYLLSDAAAYTTGAGTQEDPVPFHKEFLTGELFLPDLRIDGGYTIT